MRCNECYSTTEIRVVTDVIQNMKYAKISKKFDPFHATLEDFLSPQFQNGYLRMPFRGKYVVPIKVDSHLAVTP